MQNRNIETDVPLFMMWPRTKEQEFAANQDFALLRSTINDQLLTLEIISHTPILTIQGEKDVQETTIQEQEENKRQSKKKDKKE